MYASERGTHTEVEWLEKLLEYKNSCYWCDRYLFSPNGKYIGTKDHLTPVSRGGSDRIGNIVPACRPCNSRKGNRTEKEYRRTISETSTYPSSSESPLPSTNTQPFEAWPEPTKKVAEVIAQIAAMKRMEEPILPFMGIDVFAKKRAVEERRKVLRQQVDEILRRRRMNPDRLLTSQEVCRLLGVCPKTLQILRREHKISYLKFGHRSIRFRHEAVLAFMRRRESCAKFAEVNS